MPPGFDSHSWQKFFPILPPLLQSKWTHDPFGAFKDGNGNIVGRGAVDMKSGTMGALEAIRNLKSSGFVPLRTIHVSILPGKTINGNTTFR